MTKQILDLLDKQEKDEINNRIDKEAISSKYWLFFGLSIVSLWLAMIANIVVLFGNGETPPATLYTAIPKGKGYEPKPGAIRNFANSHNTLKNVTSWVKEAIGESYSFGFLNFDKQVKSVEVYFTPEGYNSYVKALENSKIGEAVYKKKLEISIVAYKEPILIHSGFYQDEEFWRFKTPVVVSYFGGKEAIREKYYLETLVKKVPSYKNPRMLAIHEYVMIRM